MWTSAAAEVGAADVADFAVAGGCDVSAVRAVPAGTAVRCSPAGPGRSLEFAGGGRWVARRGTVDRKGDSAGGRRCAASSARTAGGRERDMVEQVTDERVTFWDVLGCCI